MNVIATSALSGEGRAQSALRVCTERGRNVETRILSDKRALQVVWRQVGVFLRSHATLPINYLTPSNSKAPFECVRGELIIPS